MKIVTRAENVIMRVTSWIFVVYFSFVAVLLAEDTEVIRELEELFRNYDLDVDPIGQVDLSLQDVIKQDSSTRIFPSQGLAISNHRVNMTLLTSWFKELNKGFLKLKEMDKDNNSPFLKEVEMTKTQVGNLISANCEMAKGTEKKFAITLPTIIISLAAGGIAGFASSFGASYAVGAEADNQLLEESIGLTESIGEGSHYVEENFGQTLQKYGDKLNEHEKTLYVITGAQRLLNHYKELLQYGRVIRNLNEYDFEHSKFLDLIQRRVRNNSEVRRLMSNVQWGLNGPQTLLSFSENELIPLTIEPGNHDCETTALLVKVKTVLPIAHLAATPTEKPNKWRIDSSTSLYLNPNYILENSPFRKGTTFSKIRGISAKNKVITNIFVYNNTLMMVETPGMFQMTKVCQNHTKSFQIFRNPIIKVPLDCYIQSSFLNVSTYTIIYPLYDVAKEEEIHDPSDEEFLPLYQPQEVIAFEESMIHTVIEDIFVKRKRLTQIQRELLENKKEREKINNWFQNTWNNIWSAVGKGISSAVASILAQPEIAAPVIAGIILVIIFLIWFLVRKCKKRRQPIIQVQTGKPVAQTNNV